MRKWIPCLLFLSVAFPASAQQFEIKVCFGETPALMAYVLVNDRAVGMTDAEGIFRIDPESLRTGDRISASYIGASGTTVVYSPQVARDRKCTIELTAEFELEEVTVLAKVDGWEIFQKYTHIPLVYEKRHDTKLDFEFIHRVPGEPERTVSGEILMNRQNSNLVEWDYARFESNLAIRTQDDTAGLRFHLLRDLYFTLQVSGGAVFRVGLESLRTPESFQFRTQHGRILLSFEHKGVENGQRIFLVTNKEYEFGSSRPLRYLFRVDNRSKNIVSSESIHVLPASLLNQRTLTTYELYRHRWLKPRTAVLESTDPNTGESFRLSIGNIRYNEFTSQERQQFYPKEEYKAQIKAERKSARELRRKKRRSRSISPYFY